MRCNPAAALQLGSRQYAEDSLSLGVSALNAGAGSAIAATHPTMECLISSAADL